MKQISYVSVAAFASALVVSNSTSALAEVDPDAVISHYADMALAKYEDSLITAKILNSTIDVFLETPNTDTMAAARAAWLAARIPYQQTEVFRFGNPIVDDWEGRVNAWPLDEGLIDYVAADYGTESDDNALYLANVIANKTVQIDGRTVDATSITPTFLSDTLQEAGGIEANVATGYHAIEFLLWGQDLNFDGPGAGARPFTDYTTQDCTNGNCDRRRDYLTSATNLLVSDLEEMAENWKAGGAARVALDAAGSKGALSMMLSGMGSLSYGELAGERMKLGLLLHDPEEEHDCFSDNTHNSHLFDAVGIQNVFLGRYTRIDGTQLTGPSLEQLVAEQDQSVAIELKGKLKTTVDAMQIIANRAETIEAYDQMIAEGNKEGNAIVQTAIDGLIAQTKSIEKAIGALALGTIDIEGSDSLDDTSAVFE